MTSVVTQNNHTSTQSKKAITGTASFKAGMAVGMTILGFIIIFLGICLCRYCRRRNSPGRNSPPPYKPPAQIYVPPTEDPYFDRDSIAPIQMHPRQSRSTAQILAPAGNPYEANSPTRTTSPASTANHNHGPFRFGSLQGRMGG